MKAMYQAPDVKVIRFDAEGKIMSGLDRDFGEGDILENPWQDEASAPDTALGGE